MSSVIDLVFDQEVAGYEALDRYSLACVYFEQAFEDLAKKLSIKPLTEFYSEDSDSLDDYFDDPEELLELKEKLGSEEFFDPAEALKSVVALRDYLTKFPIELENLYQDFDKDPQELINELTELERSLGLALSQGVKFYFVLTPD